MLTTADQRMDERDTSSSPTLYPPKTWHAERNGDLDSGSGAPMEQGLGSPTPIAGKAGDGGRPRSRPPRVLAELIPER